MITDEQYESLFAFCRRHYVQYYDVQVELADHLSAAIEERMINNPKLSFEQALDAVYAGFGIKGFADIVAAKEKLAEKKSRKERLNLFLSYFTFPKALFIFFCYSIFISIGFLFPSFDKEFITILLSVALMVYDFYSIYQTRRIFKSQKKELLYTVAKFESIIKSCLIVQIFVNSKLWILIGEKTPQMSSTAYCFVIAILVLTFVSILAQQSFTKKLYNRASQIYPLAFSK